MVKTALNNHQIPTPAFKRKMAAITDIAFRRALVFGQQRLGKIDAFEMLETRRDRACSHFLTAEELDYP